VATETREIGAQRAGEERVTPLELFFDLVFVLSFTQVTLKTAENPGWRAWARDC
jgi:low temperature requirement protein LtrA